MFRSRTTARNNQGQATLETLVSSLVLSVVLTGAGWIVKAEWDRGKCAYLVFERTHAALVADGDDEENSGLDPLSGTVDGAGGDNRAISISLPRVSISVLFGKSSSPVSVTSTDDDVTGSAHCGGAQENLTFKKLEAVPW